MKHIFLTGTSSGIGLAIAKAAVARGDAVWGSSRDPTRIPRLPHLHGVRLDLSDPRSIHDSFDAALVAAGDCEVVIKNAGSGHFGPAKNLSDEAIANQFQILV